MTKNRYVSLTLSILMILQMFVPLPAHAMANTQKSTTQTAQGQMNGRRSEIFEFKNNEKPKFSWFTARTQSLFGARDVGLTKSEKVKIETTTFGLDDGEKEFNWEAFGQNKKFEAWIEVSYAGEVDKKGEPIRHKVSEDFDINTAGTIDTTIAVDAAKTVDNYYIVTEYDKEPDSFKINAFFDRPTIKSDKREKSLTFKLGVHQIVSTKISYNLIDEYGKEIDLNDAKEAKPADADLKNLAKLGNGTDDPVATFNLKNEGTENLWQEQALDEWDLMDSSLSLSLAKDQVTSGGIDYKLISSYDVINGGKVTIKRQKDVVTPKDQHNPGNTPDGYARIKLVADETGNGSRGTFTTGDATDTTRVVDVKAGKAYTVAKAEIEKQGKPFPLTEENKEDKGKTFKAWAPELSTLGTAVDKATKTLNATYQASKVEIIPYLPNEPVPTHDKDNLPIPTNYVTVTFKSEDATKGNVKIGDKEGATVLAKVKPGIDLSQKTEITTVPAEHYGFTQWKPALTKAADGQTYTAYFVKSGEEIGKNDPIPNGWYRVTVSQDADSIVAGTVPTKYYPVEPGGKLASDKFPSLTSAAKDGYKDPAWYVGSDKVAKPYEVEINSSMDFIARATELESHKITKDNGLKAVDFTAYKGDTMGEDFWKKGVKLEKANDNLQKLLDAAKVTDATTPARTTKEAGEKVGTLKVTFKDGSTIEVQNQKLTVIDTKVEIDYAKDSDKDANAPRHKDEVVKGKIKTTETVEGAKVEILDKENKVIGITLAKADGSFIAGTRELQAGETIKVRVTLPKAGKASDAVEKVVKLNPDRINALLPIAKAQKESFSKKQNAIIKAKLEALNTAITEAEKLVDENGKAKGADTAENQKAIDTAVTNLEDALKALTANIPPTISGPKTHEIFVDEALDLKSLVDVTDGDGADDLVVENGSNVKISAVKVDGQTETPVTDLSTINKTVGTYKVTYTAKDKSNAEVTHEMTLTVKLRTNSAIEVTTDPSKMSYLITEKDGKAQLDLTGMTLNLVDTLGDKTKVELTDQNVTFKVNGKEIKNGGDLTLADDVHFIEVEYKQGKDTLKAQTKGVLRVGPDYDKDGTDDRTQNFDPKKIEKLVVVKQPQLDYIAKDKSEDSKFKLNLEGMIVRMTDKAGKEKLAVVSEGKFVEYDDTTKEIAGLTATPAHGAKLTPETAENVKGDNGKTVKITGPNNSEAFTDPLKVFYDANKDGKPDHGETQKTPAPSAMARNVGENPQGTTVEGMATPGAIIKITDSQGKVLTTEPAEVKADDSGKYTATIKPILTDGTKINVTAKLGEMGESEPTKTNVFDDKNDNKQPDKDEGFNIAKATEIKFVDEPDLTYLVASKDKEVTFEGKDGKGKAIYLELSYKNGEKTESKIMTLEELMTDIENIAVTPANGTKDKIGNNPANLVGKNLEVKLKKANPEAKATSTTAFDIKVDADNNGVADEKETTATPTVTARNIGKKPTKTTVEGKAPKGSTVTIKYTPDGGQETTKTVTATDGTYKLEIEPKLDAGKEVKVTAKDGEKQPSPEVKAEVFDDKDNDGKDDKSQNFDMAKADTIEMVYDPAKMDYLVTSKEGKVKLETKGMVVKVTDKAGVAKKFTAEEIAADKTNFTVEPVEGTEIGLSDTDKPVKVTLNVENATTKVAQTSRNLSVKLDANGNGVDDEKEKLDLTKVKDIKIIKQPKLKYPITEENGTTNLDISDMIVELSDGVNKANYTAKELLEAKVGEGEKAKDGFKLTLVNSEDAQQAEIKTLAETVLAKANNENKVKITLVAKDTVKTESEALHVFEDLDKDGNPDDKQTPAPTDLKALNVKDEAFTTITGKAKKGDTLKVYGEDKKEIPVDQSNITIDENGNFTIKVSKDNKALPQDSLVFVTAKADKKDESPRTPVVVKTDADGSGTADVDETTTIKSVIARNIGTGDPKVKATFTTIEGFAEPGSKVTITFTEKGKQEATTKTVDADKTTGSYTLELNSPAILLDADTVVKASAKFGDKKDSPTIETKVFEDLNADGKDDKAVSQKTDTPTAEAFNQNIVEDGKVTNKPKTTTTITGMAEKGAKVVAKVGDVKVGETTVDANTGEYTIEATKDGSVIPVDTEIKVTAQAKDKLVSDATATIVKRDADNNKKDDKAQDFDIKKATKVEIVENPVKMDYLVKSKEGKTNFETAGLVIKLTDSAGKEVKYTAGDLKNMTNEITVEPADQAEIGVDKNNTKLKVTVKGSDLTEKPSVESTKLITVQVDADDNKTADNTETTTITSVIARNIGTGTTSPKAKATFTTIEGVAEKGSTVTIKFNNGQDVTKTVKADDQTGAYKLELKGATEAENILLPAETEVKAQAKFGEKEKSNEISTKVFEDLDADGVNDKTSGNVTDRPSALASNIGRTPAFTTITGEGEKGATITAKAKVNDQEVVVGTATADPTTGKYTIHATTDGTTNGKALKQGTLVSVTAKLDPKGESPAQPTHVFNDSDNKGQPDSSKDFNIKQAVKMEVVASPDKMVYNNGEKLNLNGLRVLITDVNGNQKIYKYEHNADPDKIEFIKAGLSVDLKQDTALSAKDYDAQTAKDGHNGRKLVVTLDTTGNTAVTEAIPPEETPTALEVNKDQTAKPTDVTAANQGSDPATKVRFKAADGAAVKIYKADDANKVNLIDGKPVKGTGDNDGYFIATLNTKLAEETWIEITAQENGKKESSPEQAKVIRDKNSNWEGGKTIKLSAPVISPIREKDKTVTVNVPKAEDKIQTIVVEDPSGNSVTLVKDTADKTWNVQGSDPAVKVVGKDGKIEIPVKDKLPLKDRDLIKVTFKDGEDPANEAFDKASVQKASQQPIVDQVYTGDDTVKIADPTRADETATTIKVKVNTNDSLTIEKQDNGTWKIKEKPGTKVEVEDGKVVVPLDPKAVKGDKIEVKTINDSKVESAPTKIEVKDKEKSTKPSVNSATSIDTKITGTAGPNADIIITITPKDGGAAKEIAGKTDKNGDFTVPVSGLKDGDTIVATATEKDKAPATSDTVTVGVDTTALDKAIQDGKDALDPKKDGKNNGTPADEKLKQAIQEGEDLKKRTQPTTPTQKELEEAKEKIEKAIEEKKATDKALDELKKAKEELDKTIDDATKDEKPNEAIKKGRKASDTASKVVDTKGKDADGKDMTSEQIKELVEKTKEETRLLRLPVIQVAINTAINNEKSIVFTTNPGRCNVTVTITRRDRSKEVYEVETGPEGTGSKTIEKALNSGDVVKVKATRITEDRPDPDYLDNYTSKRI